MMSTATLNWVLPTVDVNGNPLPAEDITEILIFEAVNGAATSQIATVPGSATTFTTDTLAPGTYVFSVEVMDAAGTSQMSATATVVVPEPAPATPEPATGLTATLNP